MALTPQDKRMIATMYEYKFTVRQIMDKFGVDKWQVYKCIAVKGYQKKSLRSQP